MTTCPTCGAQVAPTTPTCGACGTAVPAASTSAAYGGVAGPPPLPPAGAAAGVGAPQVPSSEARGWAIAAHLGGLGTALLSVAVLGFLGPLAVWLVKRDEDPFVDHHAKEALNFQLTVLVALLAGVVLTIPALIVGVLTLGIGLVLLAGLVAAAVIAWFVLPIVGAVKASNGEGYRYPVTIRFVR